MTKGTGALISRIALSLFFIFAGIWHFVETEKYLQMMPPLIPAPLFMVYLSGVLEILLGILILPEKTRRAAGVGMIGLLAAVFPANIYLALNPDIWPRVPAWLLWARLPFQAVFMFWAWKAAVKKPAHKA